MRKNWLLGLAVCALAVGAAKPAHADFNIATGLKWVPLRYTFPQYPTGGGGNTGIAGEDGYGWQTTSLDNYLAFFFTEQIGLQLSLDLGYSAEHIDPGNNGNTIDRSYFQFGVGVGGKFYLNRPTKERVSPYLFVNLFKYFASASTTEDVPNDQAAFLAAFHAPVGFDLAFGAEYFFTTSFSLGAEVLGLRYAYVSGSLGDLTQSRSYFTMYTGISLNYRFLATASVRTYEEEEDQNNPRPVRRPRPRPRPTEPPPDDTTPPPSPESVD